MGCQYTYYKDEELTQSYPHLYCSVTNRTCIYSKKCEKVQKWIELDGDKWKECYLMIEAQMESIPSGSYYVIATKPNKNGLLYLYLAMENGAEKVLSSFTSLNQNYVYVKDTVDGYEVSLKPFKTKKN